MTTVAAKKYLQMIFVFGILGKFHPEWENTLFFLQYAQMYSSLSEFNLMLDCPFENLRMDLLNIVFNKKNRQL